MLIKSANNMQEKEEGWLQACWEAELLIHNDSNKLERWCENHVIQDVIQLGLM